MTPHSLIIASLALPLLACLACVVFAKQANLRDGLTLIGAIALFATVLSILQSFQQGTVFELELWTFMPGIKLAFEIEPLGLVFALSPHSCGS